MIRSNQAQCEEAILEMYLPRQRILESRDTAKRFPNSRNFGAFLQNPRLKLHWDVKTAGDPARFDIEKGNRFDDWLKWAKWRIRRSTLRWNLDLDWVDLWIQRLIAGRALL
jgi:hypothetical protein